MLAATTPAREDRRMARNAAVRRPLVTDVQLTIRLPRTIRNEWSARLRFDCRCGFPRGKHPLCAGCGIAIGPDHLQRRGREVPIDVYADSFDEDRGVWVVRRLVEPQLVCANCAARVILQGRRLAPVRRNSMARTRLLRINAWRRAHHQPMVGPETELSPAELARVTVAGWRMLS